MCTYVGDNDDDDGGNDIAAIVGVVVGVVITVAVVIGVMVILYYVKQKGNTKDYGTRQDSHNEYAEQPVASGVRLVMHCIENYVCEIQYTYVHK